MKNKLRKETTVPSTREESIDMIIRKFLKSSEPKIDLALSDQEVSELLTKYEEIYIEKGKNPCRSQNGLAFYNVFKHS